MVIYLNQHDFRDMDAMTTEHLDIYQAWSKCPGQMVCQVGKWRGWAPVVNSLLSISAIYTLLSLRQQTQLGLSSSHGNARPLHVLTLMCEASVHTSGD